MFCCLLPAMGWPKQFVFSQPKLSTSQQTTADQSTDALRRAKWRRNINLGIIPSMVMSTVTHTIEAQIAAPSATRTGLRALGVAELAAAVGLGIYAQSLPQQPIEWSPNFCAAAKWALCGGSLAGAAMVAATDGPTSMLRFYGRWACVYLATGVGMHYVGVRRRQAQAQQTGAPLQSVPVMPASAAELV